MQRSLACNIATVASVAAVVSALGIWTSDAQAAEPSEGAFVVLSSRTLPGGQRVGTVRLAPARAAHGPMSATPPPPPPGFDGEAAEGAEQLGAPVFPSRERIPLQKSAETRAVTGNAVLTPATTVILRDSALAPPSGWSSSVNEPSVGSQADGMLTTHNWYASISTDEGATYGYVSPYTTFPNTPAEFSAGFCCDQRASQDSSRDLVFWFLQYIKNGSVAGSSNGDRLAVAHGQAGLAANTWKYYDLTPAMFSLTGKWLDFPQLQLSANYLYFTSNIFSTTTDGFYGAVVGRIPLAQLDAGSAISLDYFVATTYGSIAPVTGATAEGSRAGRTTMYFGAVSSSTSLVVLTWPEASSTPTATTVTGLASTGSATFACPGPGGLDPCTRANSRAQTGWITDTELGFMWASSANVGAGRPYPFTRVAILDPATLAIVSQPDIWSSTSAWLYPAVSVNQRGHLGGSIDNLGGNALPVLRALIRDDLSPDVVTNGWETVSVAASTDGTVGRWGDYNGSVPHEKYPNTWLATGHAQSGGSGNSSSVPHNFWFGRARDTDPALPALDFYTLPPCRVLDTRVGGSGGPLAANTPRTVAISGLCTVPATAKAVAINLTAVTPPSAGSITLFPGDATITSTTAISISTGQTRANNAVMRLSGKGSLIAVPNLSSGSVDIVIDVVGYFR